MFARAQEGENRIKNLPPEQIDAYANATEEASPWKGPAHSFVCFSRKYYLFYFSIFIVTFSSFSAVERVSILSLIFIWCVLRPTHFFWDTRLSVKDIYLITRRELRVVPVYLLFFIIGALGYVGISYSNGGEHLPEPAVKWAFLALSTLSCELALQRGAELPLFMRIKLKYSMLCFGKYGIFCFSNHGQVRNFTLILMNVMLYLFTILWVVFYTMTPNNPAAAVIFYTIMMGIPCNISLTNEYLRTRSILIYAEHIPPEPLRTK